jgi:hypothetical protein
LCVEEIKVDVVGLLVVGGTAVLLVVLFFL